MGSNGTVAVTGVAGDKTMNTDVLFSSGKDDWRTPPEFFKNLNDEFGFTLDPCCTIDSALCGKFFTEEEDGLAQDWGTNVVFVNPPYSQCRKWVKKAYESSLNGATVVMLIPARTDTRMFHDYIYDYTKWKPRPGVEIRFIKGRLRFVGAQSSAPFPSMVVVFRPLK